MSGDFETHEMNQPKISYLKERSENNTEWLDELINKISKRVNQMMKDGAIKEVKDFLKLNLKSDSNIFKVIGIREIKEFIDKKNLYA